MKTPTLITCPTCGKQTTYTLDNEHRPFCSERCKLIDFGAWASEQHVIAGDELHMDINLMEALEDSEKSIH